MPNDIFPRLTPEVAKMRARLTPDVQAAFENFSERVFSEGKLSAKTKHLIAVAAAHITQCPYCIRSHTGTALRNGASPEEIMEAIWVAVEMRAGGAYAHSSLALASILKIKCKEDDRRSHDAVGTEETHSRTSMRFDNDHGEWQDDSGVKRWRPKEASHACRS